MKNLHKILIILGIVFILSGVFWLAFDGVLADSNNLEVSFLDVGQGDSILIETPYGQNILIDGGPNKKVIQGLSEELPFWDRTIDLMILTHPHEDHVGGLVDVLKRYDVREVLYTGVNDESAAYGYWLNIIKNKNIPLLIIDKSQSIKLGEDCFLRILYPQDSFFGKAIKNLNNSSIVSKLDCGVKKFLFMGDGEIEVERDLVGRGLDLSADILKLGHHGSDTASSEEFLSAVNPESVVIQVGEENKFGHPSRRILKRLEKWGVDVLRNDLDGTIRFVY